MRRNMPRCEGRRSRLASAIGSPEGEQEFELAAIESVTVTGITGPIREVRVKRDVDQLRKEIADNNKSSLANYRKSGVKQVEIYSALDDRCCPQCKAAHGTVLDVKEALKRPTVVPECTSQYGRCVWLPVVDL